MSPMSFCAVPMERLVYAGPKTREEFDLIAIEPQVHAWQPCEWWAASDENDGRQWERRCTSKTIGEIGDRSGVTVIFQWFDYRQVEVAGGAA